MTLQILPDNIARAMAPLEIHQYRDRKEKWKRTETVYPDGRPKIFLSWHTSSAVAYILVCSPDDSYSTVFKSRKIPTTGKELGKIQPKDLEVITKIYTGQEFQLNIQPDPKNPGHVEQLKLIHRNNLPGSEELPLV